MDVLRSGRLSIRLYGLVGLAALAGTVLLGAALHAQWQALWTARTAVLATAAADATRIIEAHRQLAEAGRLDLAEAQQRALAAVQAMGRSLVVLDAQGSVLAGADPARLGSAAPELARAAGQGVLRFQGEGAGDVPAAMLGIARVEAPWHWVVTASRGEGDLLAAFWTAACHLAAVLLAGVLALAGLAWWVLRGVLGPAAALTGALQRLAAGERVGLPEGGRLAEMRALAAAFGTVQVAMEEAARGRAREAARHEDALGRRAACEARLQAQIQDQSQAVRFVAEALAPLARGDLAVRLHADFPAEHAQLRTDFNAALGRMEDAVTRARCSAGAITRAAEDLSRRSEQQAAALTQTAVAVREVGAAARGTAQQVRRISRGVEEIAFQADLLALSAGVEPGSPIHTLPGAGRALASIAAVLGEIGALVARVSTGAEEQAGGLAEIGRVLGLLDQMRPQSNAAGAELARETARLLDLAGQFQVGRPAAALKLVVGR